MKKDLHPQYYPNAVVTCACGNTWTTGATVETIQTDVCFKCHPFYTGEQRIVDTEGQVDRFYRKLQAREEYLEDKKAREAARTSPDLAISELELPTRVESSLSKAGLEKVGDVLDRLSKGDEALLEIDGFGRKSLADVKRKLKHRGFEIPTVEAES